MNTLCLVVSWYTAVFGGWLVINYVKIGCMAVSGVSVYNSRKSSQTESTGCFLKCLFLTSDCYEIIDDLFLVQGMKDEINYREPLKKADD